MWPAAADLKIWPCYLAARQVTQNPGLLATTEKVESKWPKVCCQ
jgi:hypothetical protein